MHYIIKLENQIPMCVLKGVFDYMTETRADEILPFNHMLLDMFLDNLWLDMFLDMCQGFLLIFIALL